MTSRYHRRRHIGLQPCCCTVCHHNPLAGWQHTVKHFTKLVHPLCLQQDVQNMHSDWLELPDTSRRCRLRCTWYHGRRFHLELAQAADAHHWWLYTAGHTAYWRCWCNQLQKICIYLIYWPFNAYKFHSIATNEALRSFYSNERRPDDKHTWIKWYPLVISSAKSFCIKLGTLVLFKTNTGAGTSLGIDTKVKIDNSHRRFWLNCTLYCNAYLAWTELVLFRRANTKRTIQILRPGQPDTTHEIKYDQQRR